jgi:HEPN domain-containing protein
VNDSLKDYVNKWLFRANEDVAVIQNLTQSDRQTYASTICFHAQQAVEKYLKALLAHKGVDFPRTHDIDFLLSECRNVTSGELDHVDPKSLTDFGVSVRYPDDFYIPDPAETMYYAQLAQDVKRIVETLILSDD